MSVTLIAVGFPGKYGSNADWGGVFLENMAVIADCGVVFLENMAVILFVVGCSWKIWQQYCLWWGVPGKYGSNTDCGGVFLENTAVMLIAVWCSWKISITAIFSRNTTPQSVLLPYFPGTPTSISITAIFSRNIPPQSVLLPYFPGTPHHNQYYCHIFQNTPTTISITAIFSRNTSLQSV